MTRFPATRPIAHAHHELCIADLDAITGGGTNSAALSQTGTGKAGMQPNQLVVIAIIAILIG